MKRNFNENANTSTKRPRNSACIDPRPIRDPKFIKEAKFRIINFLEQNDYNRPIDLSSFDKFSQSDVKSIFENFINVFCRNFRLNESKDSGEARIVNFFKQISNTCLIAASYITSPSIISSRCHIVAAFDFLRRIATAEIHAFPMMMFPKIQELGISSEHIVDCMVRMYHKCESGQMDQFEVLEMKDAIRKASGIKSNEEMNTLLNRFVEMETIIKQIEEYKIEEAQLSSTLIEIEYNNSKESRELDKIENLYLDIQKESARCLSDMDADKNILYELQQKKKRFDELGYGDQLKDIQKGRAILAKKLDRCGDLKSGLDRSTQKIHVILTEIDDLKFIMQRVFGDVFKTFGDLRNQEFLDMVNKFEVQHLVEYQLNLKVKIDNFTTAIEKRCKEKQLVIDNNEKAIEKSEQEKQVMEKRIQALSLTKNDLLDKIDQATEANRILNEKHLELSEKHARSVKICQDKQKQIDKLEEHLSKLKIKVEEARLFNDQSQQFYDADVEFREKSAEIMLQCYQDCSQFQLDLLEEEALFFEETNVELEKENRIYEEFISAGIHDRYGKHLAEVEDFLVKLDHN